MSEWINRVHFGDCLDTLRRMPDGIVHTCVTSPPYFGLRDYGHAGQIGLEGTPDAFIAKLVEVFREVRRVLRDDGTLWLNCGDSYFGGGRGGGGSFSALRPGWREVPCGTSGTAPASSPARDCLCGSLCDGCRKAYRIGKAHSGSRPAPMPVASQCESIHGHTESVTDRLPTSDSSAPAARTSSATLDRPQAPAPSGDETPGVPASTTPESSRQPLDSCSPELRLVAGCQLCGGSLQGCAQAFAHTGECSFCTASRESAAGTEGTGVSGSAHPYSASASLKPKDLIGVPWMLAFALRADGWYLRQDIVWSKPNPMPESVTDRCTKAHEYIFLLSKSPRYYCDMAAIKEPAIGGLAGNVRPAKGAQAYEDGATEHRTKAGLHAWAEKQRSRRDSFKRDDSKRAEAIPGQSVGTHREDREESAYQVDERNKRTVWTVATKPYAGAHFATFPEELIEPCILAGAPAGGVVLDPFFGSGTTGQVAQNLGRQWIGCELNPAYKPLQDERLRQPGLILEAA